MAGSCHCDSDVTHRAWHVGSQFLPQRCEAKATIALCRNHADTRGCAEKTICGLGIASNFLSELVMPKGAICKTIGDFEFGQRPDDLADPITPDQSKHLFGDWIRHAPRSIPPGRLFFIAGIRLLPGRSSCRGTR